VLENAALANQNPNPLDGRDEQSGHGLIIVGEGTVPVDYTRSFVVNITNDGSVLAFSMLNIREETYLRVIESVLTSGSASGVVEIRGRSWMYSMEKGSGRSDSPYAISIVFLDIDEANRGLGSLLANLIIIGIIAVGAIFMISMLISNRAIKPVEEGITRQKRFIADASHELKTPITVIAANAEAAIDADEANRAYWINNIYDETNRMNELVDSLLALAKAEEKEIDKSAFDLAGAVREETDRVEAFLFEKNISLQITPEAPAGEPMPIVSDKTKVQAIVSVLLENAVKYTPPGGNVFVSISKTRISVSNTGAFIPPENLARIFDRFYRVDPSRNSETGGHGIGLSIAKEIANALGGRLSAESVMLNQDEALNTFTFFLAK
jgi:signal transduction histidine kinase